MLRAIQNQKTQNEKIKNKDGLFEKQGWTFLSRGQEMKIKKHKTKK
jgi:hypothetical protein